MRTTFADIEAMFAAVNLQIVQNADGSYRVEDSSGKVLRSEVILDFGYFLPGSSAAGDILAAVGYPAGGYATVRASDGASWARQTLADFVIGVAAAKH